MHNQNKILLYPKRIVCADDERRILTDYVIEVTGDTITAIAPRGKFEPAPQHTDILFFDDFTVIPGFVQTHVHLCQTLFRGLADDLPLLDWLRKHIFPYENAHSPESLRVSAQLGILELLRSGTTAILDMGTLRHQEVIFEELIASCMSAIAGKCMIDSNPLYPDFTSTTEKELRLSSELARAFHNSGEGRIRYGFAPRFVLSCSETLLQAAHELMSDFPGSLYHTHASENKQEIEAVRKRFGKENIEYFDHIGVLDDRTVLAHCIHVTDAEVEILKTRNARVAHCPSSNMKLGSGIAPVPRYLDSGISVSLGADGAPCNNRLSPFYEMRLASLLQKPLHGPESMKAETVFRMATIEGARALHLQDRIGSIEVGKKADLVFMNLNSAEHAYSEDDSYVYGNIVYSSDSSHVRHVMVNGSWAVRNGEAANIDEERLIHKAQYEMRSLLRRIEL